MPTTTVHTLLIKQMQQSKLQNTVDWRCWVYFSITVQQITPQFNGLKIQFIFIIYHIYHFTQFLWVKALEVA